MKFCIEIICLFTAIAFMSQIARADYLYWCLDTPKYGNTSIEVDFDYATVIMTDGADKESDPLQLYGGGASGSVGETLSARSTEPVYAWFDVDKTYNTFLFELWKNGEQDEVAIRVAWQSYAIDGVSGHIFSPSSIAISNVPLLLNSVAPEPTSGVLVLLGLAVLAIRRKDIKDLN